MKNKAIKTLALLALLVPLVAAEAKPGKRPAKRDPGMRFVEERYGSIGPLGRLARRRCYPKAEQPLPDGPRYEDSDRPAEEAFDLQDPVRKIRN